MLRGGSSTGSNLAVGPSVCLRLNTCPCQQPTEQQQPCFCVLAGTRLLLQQHWHVGALQLLRAPLVQSFLSDATVRLSAAHLLKLPLNLQLTAVPGITAP